MNRTDFMAAAHKLAERLGNQLYDLVEKQTDRAKAAALAIAKGQLAAELEHVAESAPTRKRRPRRCSRCDRTGHTRRRCDSITPDLDENETEDERPAAAPVAPPPQRAARRRSLRSHRSVRCVAPWCRRRDGRSKVTAAKSCSPCLN